jgi:NAD(P)-dependent dehydrogenase (short-subunit alcohol dehydrogenase family)
MGRLEERVAFITGAASGIGAACAQRMAEEGARIAGFDLAQPESAAWKQLTDAAPAESFHIGDVRDEAAVSAAVADTVERFGRIDVLVNSAGTAGGGPVHMLEADEWDRVIDINLKGTFLCSKYVITQMLEQGSGNVINIASVEGIEGFEGGSAYNASKGGVVLLTRNQAIDYGRRGIRVNAVCPGFIETPLMASTFVEGLKEPLERIVEATQLGRMGQPEEIADAALFLASDEASYITGQTLIVDGGFTCGHRVGISKMLGLE